MSAALDDVLAALLARYGTGLARDAPRLRGLLLDECPDERRAVNLVLDAGAEGVPGALAEPGGVPIDALVPRLAERLVAERGIAAGAARWAVTVWARALGHRQLALVPLDETAIRVAPSLPRDPPPPPAPGAWAATPRWLKLFGIIVGGLAFLLVFRPGAEPERAREMSGGIAPNAGMIALRVVTKEGLAGYEIAIPVVARGARNQRCEIQAGWHYRNGGRVTVRAPNTGYSSPNGQIGRMAYFTPPTHDDARDVRIVFPQSVFPERDLTGRVEYDLVASLACGGRTIADRVRRPLVERTS